MDTTLIYNQVKIPYGINTYVENLPDTVSVQVQDPLRVVRDHEYDHSGYEELDQIIESTKIFK